MTTDNIGFRDINRDPPLDSLRGQMSAAPTGRQLTSDGTFVKSVFTTDPALALLNPPDGTEVTWNNGGVLKDCKFTRETGWLYSAAYS